MNRRSRMKRLIGLNSILRIILCNFNTIQYYVAACDIADSDIVSAISNGKLSLARRLSAATLFGAKDRRHCEEKLSSLYKVHANRLLDRLAEDDAWNSDLIQTSRFDEMMQSQVDADSTSIDTCWNPPHESSHYDFWDACCSHSFGDDRACAKHIREAMALENNNQKSATVGINKRIYKKTEIPNVCCNLKNGSSSYLRLPALNELSLRLTLPQENTDESVTLYLEQDGFLRKFDPASILWPTAYLLALCVSAPKRCGIEDSLRMAVERNKGSMNIVELGAGIGAPSIAAARTMHNWHNNSFEKMIVATDKAAHALALIRANAGANLVPGQHIAVARLDHSDISEVKKLAKSYAPGFALVLGSSLQSLFDESTRNRSHLLWQILDEILDQKNEGALAILAHSINTVEPCGADGEFELVKTISGLQFGMRTRWNANASDFVISVFRRKRRAARVEL